MLEDVTLEVTLGLSSILYKHFLTPLLLVICTMSQIVKGALRRCMHIICGVSLTCPVAVSMHMASFHPQSEQLLFDC